MTTDAKPIPNPPRPRLAKRGLNVSAPQVLLVLGVVAALSVVINFSARIQVEQRISAEASQMRIEVTALAATQQALATQLAYVKSDAYVEYWAHTDGRMVRSGEVLVVPVAGHAAKPTPAPQPAPSAEPVNKLQIWWEMFFWPAS